MPDTSAGSIREVTEQELPRLLELYENLHASDSPLPEPAEVARVWRELCSHDGVHVLVVEAGSEFVASCTLVIVPNLTRSCRPYGLVENVVTRKEYRRRGFGTVLLREALRRAWETGCYKVMLLTGSKDPGVHEFYEGAGFVAGDKTGFVARP